MQSENQKTCQAPNPFSNKNCLCTIPTWNKKSARRRKPLVRLRGTGKVIYPNTCFSGKHAGNVSPKKQHNLCRHFQLVLKCRALRKCFAAMGWQITLSFGEKTMPGVWNNMIGSVVGNMCNWFNENVPPTLGKLTTDFGKMSTDFGKMSHRLWGNLSPILGKSVTGFADFVEIRRRLEEVCHRLCGNTLPILGQSVPDSATDFGEICYRFCETPFSGENKFLGKTWCL